MSASVRALAGSPTMRPAGSRPEGLTTGASGKGGVPGLRWAPMCHSCGKIAAPSAWTAAATLRQAASASAP